MSIETVSQDLFHLRSAVHPNLIPRIKNGKELVPHLKFHKNGIKPVWNKTGSVDPVQSCRYNSFGECLYIDCYDLKCLPEPIPMRRIRRTNTLSSKMYYKFLDHYNMLLDYTYEDLGFVPSLKVWQTNTQQLRNSYLGKDVIIALQLNIYCRHLGFPSFIMTTHKHTKWIVSLKRLRDIIKCDSELDNQPFLWAKVLVCLSMEYTARNKRGKAQECLYQAAVILDTIEASEFQAWFHLAMAYYLNSMPFKSNISTKERSIAVCLHLRKAHKYLSEENTDACIYRLERTLIVWWMFLAETGMTKCIKSVMLGIDSQPLHKRLENTPDNALVVFRQFWSMVNELHWCQTKVAKEISLKLQTLTDFLNAKQHPHTIVQKNGVVEEDSEQMERYFEEFATITERSDLSPLFQCAYLHEERHEIHVHIKSPDKEEELRKFLHKFCPKLVHKVVIRKSFFSFTIKTDADNNLAADQERIRMTHGQQKSTFGPGSMVFPIENKHKENVLLAGDIHVKEDILQKVHGITEVPPSTSVTCIVTDANKELFALTVQHLFTLDEGHKTEADIGCCVLSQINYKSKPYDTPSEMFLLGNQYNGLYSIHCSQMTTDDSQPDKKGATHEETTPIQSDKSNSSAARSQNVQTESKTLIDLSAIKMDPKLCKAEFLQPFLTNESTEPVSVDMPTKSSQIHSRLEVQKIGATSGFTKGTIISTHAIVNLDNGLRSRNVFIVSGKDNNPFATHGDSGALVTPCIGTAKTTLALGYVCKNSDTDEHGGPVVLCLNFKKSLDCLNKISNLDLMLHNPMECEKQAESPQEDLGFTETEENNTVAHGQQAASTLLHDKESHDPQIQKPVTSRNISSDSDSGIEKDGPVEGVVFTPASIPNDADKLLS